MELISTVVRINKMLPPQEMQHTKIETQKNKPLTTYLLYVLKP